MTTYYKFLSNEGVGRHSGFKWPLPQGDQPGEWVEVQGPVEACVRGLHAVEKVEDLPRWVNEALFELEYDGTPQQAEHKVVGGRARLVRQLRGWNLREWAIDVAEHVLPIFERRYPGDNRPRKAVETARLYLRGGVTSGRLLAARREAADAYAADAYAAAYAAYAADAYADAYAAYAAAYAADAADAYAAYAAAYAAYAAAYAADAADAYARVGGAVEREWQGRRILELANR